jgi:hypothetical protein
MHVLDRFGVVSKNTEVVYGITIDRVAVNFFMVIEDTVTPEGSCPNDVSICENISEYMLANVHEPRGAWKKKNLHKARR